MLLPQDLQSALIKTSARGRLAEYGKYLLDAIRIWRRAGTWRSSGGNPATADGAAGSTSILAARTIAEFLRLAEQRRKKGIREAKAANLRQVAAASRERPAPMPGLAATSDDQAERPAIGYRPGHPRLGVFNPWSNDNALRPARRRSLTSYSLRSDFLRPVVSKLEPERPLLKRL